MGPRRSAKYHLDLLLHVGKMVLTEFSRERRPCNYHKGGMASHGIELPTRGFSVLLPYRDYVTLSENKNQHVCHRVQRLSSKFQGFECGQHLDFKFFVMHIQRVKVLRLTPALW